MEEKLLNYKKWKKSIQTCKINTFLFPKDTKTTSTRDGIRNKQWIQKWEWKRNIMSQWSTRFWNWDLQWENNPPPPRTLKPLKAIRTKRKKLENRTKIRSDQSKRKDRQITANVIWYDKYGSWYNLGFKLSLRCWPSWLIYTWSSFYV